MVGGVASKAFGVISSTNSFLRLGLMIQPLLHHGLVRHLTVLNKHKEMMPSTYYATSFLATALTRRKPAAVMSLLSPAFRLLNNRSAVVTFSSSPTSHADVEAQPKRRTRRRQLPNSSSSNSSSKEPIPSLADFMHRAKVRKQYRNFVRLAHFVDGKKSNGNDSNTKTSSSPNNATGECRAALEEVRLSYQLGIKKATDSLSKSMAYNEGERRLRELEAIVGYSPSSSNRNVENDGVDKGRTSEESYDADSWINIKDDEDKRGRVGVVWPWERDDASK